MIELVVHPSGRRPGHFSAVWNGRQLCRSRTPLLSAARVLMDEGVPSETELTMRHANSNIVAMRTTVGVAARLTVEERDKESPRFAPWKPFSMDAVTPPAAVLGSGAGVGAE